MTYKKKPRLTAIERYRKRMSPKTKTEIKRRDRVYCSLCDYSSNRIDQFGFWRMVEDMILQAAEKRGRK